MVNEECCHGVFGGVSATPTCVVRGCKLGGREGKREEREGREWREGRLERGNGWSGYVFGKLCSASHHILLPWIMIFSWFHLACVLLNSPLILFFYYFHFLFNLFLFLPTLLFFCHSSSYRLSTLSFHPHHSHHNHHHNPIYPHLKILLSIYPKKWPFPFPTSNHSFSHLPSPSHQPITPNPFPHPILLHPVPSPHSPFIKFILSPLLTL